MALGTPTSIGIASEPPVRWRCSRHRDHIRSFRNLPPDGAGIADGHRSRIPIQFQISRQMASGRPGRSGAPIPSHPDSSIDDSNRPSDGVSAAKANSFRKMNQSEPPAHLTRMISTYRRGRNRRPTPEKISAILNRVANPNKFDFFPAAINYGGWGPSSPATMAPSSRV